MEYRTLARTGVKVSSICLGTANFADPTNEQEATAIVDAALDAGINLIDTGDSYANGEAERYLGNALARNKRRGEAIISTKVGLPVGSGPNDRGSSRLHVLAACEASLRRLQTDYIDLYQIHRDFPDVALDETLAALTDLVRQGKVRYVGCSTFPAWRVMEALMLSELRGYVRFVAEQPPYNLLDRRIENELVPLCRAHGLGLIPWSPMAMGILAGRYSGRDEYPPDSRASLRGGIYAERVGARGIETGAAFVALAERFGIPPAQLAILWVKDQEGVTAPLIGPRSVDQLEHLLPVADLALTEELRAECDRLVPPGSAVANFHNTAGWMKAPAESP
jgi:aryl-alcohol dehydrogenase-like predicted oxidoreductase